MESSEDDPSPQTFATGGPASPRTHPPALGQSHHRATGMSSASLVLILLGAGTLWLLSSLYKAERLKLDSLARNYDNCIEELAAGSKDDHHTETKTLVRLIRKCVDDRLQLEDALEANGMRD